MGPSRKHLLAITKGYANNLTVTLDERLAGRLGFYHAGFFVVALYVKRFVDLVDLA
jgi:hypothetical protein